jgi:microsomal dipeptidase-like Zn-dependent dipeptidase
VRVARALRWGCVTALAACIAASPAFAGPRPVTNPVALANHCFKLTAGKRVAATVYLKPTGFGTYVLHDKWPGEEWAITRARGGRFDVRSTKPGGTTLGTFRFFRARGCRVFPEAALGAVGKSFKGTRRDGTVLGFADPHMHVTADLRGGGLVIAGHTFDRFGVAEALGHDADVHGDDGSLDITGNLLRSGSLTGTHDTHGWPSFAGWPTFDTYTHTQVYWRWLERAWMSGLRLLGAQLVEDEPLCNIEPRKSHSCNETETIELEMRELRALQDYIDAQHGGRGRGWFRLVTDPRSARRVIERGKLAVVVGVESSNPFGCSQREGQPQCTKADIDDGIERLKRLGVRTIFPAHWTDNAFAGAALEGGDKGTFISAMQVSYTGAPFQTGPCPQPGQGEEVPPLPGRQCNTRGLTDLGDYALRRLMDNHMLIEADHLSEWARQKALAIAEGRHYPLVSSHTGTGGLWTPDELRRLYGVGGTTVATIDDAKALPEKILAFRRYQSANKTFGIGIGTDAGGFNALPGAQPLTYPFRPYRGHVLFSRQRTGTKTYDLGKDGVAHYGLLPDLLAAMQTQPHGREALGALYHSAEAYLQMWERADGG